MRLWVSVGVQGLISFEDGYLLELGLSLRHDERVSKGAMFELKVGCRML